VGGVSFMSVRSLYEAYLARKINGTVSHIENSLFFGYSFFNLKFKIFLMKSGIFKANSTWIWK
jgi:hypothetical protein